MQIIIKGAIDLTSSIDFNSGLQDLKMKWDNFKYSVHPSKRPLFYEWLIKNESNVIKTSLLVSVRETAGLGSPTVPYTTNGNESMNKVATQVY